MGTPEFAEPSLRALVENGAANAWQVVAVATQPDRRAGRGKKLVESPIKQLALQYGIRVLQPTGFRKHPDAVEDLRNLAPDLYVVAAYGIILPKSVLDIATYGSINVHASLLPAYRGASPITAAILDGEQETGVSIMLMDEGMDTGPVLEQVRQPILAGDTTASLSTRLAEQGADALVDTLPRWLDGEIAPLAQEDLPGEASVCRMIKKEEGRIDWQRLGSAHRTHDARIRAVAQRLYLLARPAVENLAGGGSSWQGIARVGRRHGRRPGRRHWGRAVAVEGDSAGGQAQHGSQELRQWRSGLRRCNAWCSAGCRGRLARRNARALGRGRGSVDRTDGGSVSRIAKQPVQDEAHGRADEYTSKKAPQPQRQDPDHLGL